MTTPDGDGAFLRKLELNVRTELTQAGTSQPEEEASSLPVGEQMFTLLGAVEALEDPGIAAEG
jgi:hypothetical protein